MAFTVIFSPPLVWGQASVIYYTHYHASATGEGISLIVAINENPSSIFQRYNDTERKHPLLLVPCLTINPKALIIEQP